MKLSTLPIPDDQLDEDTRATIELLLKPVWMEVTGSTLNLGPLIAARVLAAEESIKKATEQAVDEKRHMDQYSRFCAKLTRHPRLMAKRPYLAPMLTDIKFWEAGKAEVRVSDAAAKAWFWELPSRQRMALVKIIQADRILERRFRLKNKGSKKTLEINSTSVE